MATTICEADNHWLQLHGLYHMLTAMAIYPACMHIHIALRR